MQNNFNLINLKVILLYLLNVMPQACLFFYTVSNASTLSKEQIREIYQSYLTKYYKGENAEERLSGFFDGKPFEELSINHLDQRTILVAGNYRKEVTSTVMWLLNHGIKVQCFKATAYKYLDDILLDMEQIIPVKEAEDYIIKMADKAIKDKEIKENYNQIISIRLRFWAELLEQFNQVSNQFKNVNPSEDHWLSSGSGVSGIPFSFVVTKTHVNTELNIATSEKERNKKIFDLLYADKDEIEKIFGASLIWERQDENKRSRILHKLAGVNIAETSDWAKIKDFLCDSMPRLEKAFKERLKISSNKN